MLSNYTNGGVCVCVCMFYPAPTEGWGASVSVKKIEETSLTQHY